MNTPPRKLVIGLLSLFFLGMSACSSSKQNKAVYAFQMGKSTGESPSYFRVALTIYDTKLTTSSSFSEYEIPGESESSSGSEPSASVSSQSITTDSTTSNSYMDSIDSLSYDRSFVFEFINHFNSSSSSQDSSTQEKSSDSVSSSSLGVSSSEPASSGGGSSSSESNSDSSASLFGTGSHVFAGYYAIDPESNMFFQITFADNQMLPGGILNLFLKAKYYSDHIDITIPVSIKDALSAIIEENPEDYHSVTIGLNKE